jgi:hypothetical protein
VAYELKVFLALYLYVPFPSFLYEMWNRKATNICIVNSGHDNLWYKITWLYDLGILCCSLSSLSSHFLVFCLIMLPLSCLVKHDVPEEKLAILISFLFCVYYPSRCLLRSD